MIGSLCTGYAGLDAAASSVFGGGLAWVAENDRAARTLLEYRFPDVPNLGDMTRIDWAQVPPVKVLAAGIPCQGWSAAGKRKGHDDERWLWADMAEAIRVMRPRWVIVENVPGLLRKELVDGTCECDTGRRWLALLDPDGGTVCPDCGRCCG